MAPGSRIAALGLHSRTRPLVLAWIIGLVGVLAQVLIGGCAPHPDATEELDELDRIPTRGLGERSELIQPPLALTAVDGTHLRLSSIGAHAVIEGPLAFTELHLAFDSADDSTIEGRFRIELPPRAAISRFAMKIGDEWQEGEVVERQAARVAYEESLHRRRDPALLEHEAGNTFSARVFPIAPGERKEIIVSYSQELASASEPYRLGLRGLPRLDSFDARVIRHGKDPVLVSQRDWWPDHDVVVELEGEDEPIALRHANFAVARVRLEGAEPPRALGAVTVLFDTSASRALGFDIRIHRLGDLVSALLERNDADFPLRVIAFDQGAAPIYDGMAADFGVAELDALAARRALGASDIVGALSAVADDADGVDRVVLLTDGIATAGLAEIVYFRGIAALLAQAGVDRIDTVLDGGSRDETRMRALVTTGLAERGIVVDAGLPPQTIADKLCRVTLPALDVEVPGARWVWPQRLEGAQTGDEVLVYADVDGPMRVSLGHAAPIVPEPIAVERPLIERAWVRANIERLQAERSAMPFATDHRLTIERNIVALSTEFRVLSDLTALLVLETEADYERHGIARRALADILVVGEHGPTLWRRGPRTPKPPHRGELHSGYAPVGLMQFVDPSRSAYGAAYAVGNDDDDVWGGLAGTTGLSTDGVIGSGGSTAGFGGRGTRVPRVRQGKIDVKGALDRYLIRRIARAHLNEIRACYNQGLVRDPSLRGRVTIQFSIGPGGGVAAAVVAATTLPDPNVGSCAAKAVKRWKFPRPDGGGNVIVTVPFELGSDPAPRGATPVRAPRMPPPQGEPIPISPTPPPMPAEVQRDAYDGPFGEAMTALAEGRKSDALATTLAWRERDAGDVLALIALGEIAEAIGDLPTAARAYGSIIDLHPARAELRRWAGTRLERLGPSAIELAVDTYAKALESRDDHPSSHRMFAWAALRAGRHADAFEALQGALASPSIPWDRFPRVQDILRDDLAIVGAVWIARDPSARSDVERALARIHLRPARTPSARFVLSWETDANDVDFHIEDAQGGHASYADRELVSGGELYADITTGYGPECFAIDGSPQAGPYRLYAHYFSQGPMGFGMGNVQIVAHDGRGGLRIEDRPFVALRSGGRVDLGSWSPN